MPLSVYTLLQTVSREVREEFEGSIGGTTSASSVFCRGGPLRTPAPTVGSELARLRLCSGPEYLNHGDTEATEIRHSPPSRGNPFSVYSVHATHYSLLLRHRARQRYAAALRDAVLPACCAASIRLGRMLFEIEGTEIEPEARSLTANER
jgi:hypothetical protein